MNNKIGEKMQNIIITGASGGMGSATCRLLVSLGYNVYGLDVYDAKIAGVHFVQTDITSMSSIKNAFEKIKKEVDSVYAIIHFAGIYKLNSLIEISEEEFLKTFDINLFGMYRMNKMFCPLLNKGSRIIITSSELAPLQPLPFTSIYAITKTAIERYAYGLRMELQMLGISVSIIRPGAVNTGLLPASTMQLDKFCQETKLYQCNAVKFKKIVDSVETKNIEPIKIANIAQRILKCKKPKYCYNINRNFYLRLLNFLPQHLQTKIIKRILTPKVK